MPSLKQIKRRIVGVKNTGKITRAMKLVAAAKMKRAQENMERIRPYAWKMREVIATLTLQTDPSVHPLLRNSEPKRIGILNVTSDRGLCGSFNTNISRRTSLLLHQNKHLDVELLNIGRKGDEFFKKRGAKIFKYFPGVFQDLDFTQANSIGKSISDIYINGGFDRIYMVYNEFKNAAQQTIVSEQLLPIVPQVEVADAKPIEFLFEPNAGAVLDQILPLYVNIQIWRVLLESYASEQAARMSAMENATKNAKELATNLTLQYNKARQASITKELLEIVGGAEGLK